MQNNRIVCKMNQTHVAETHDVSLGAHAATVLMTAETVRTRLPVQSSHQIDTLLYLYFISMTDQTIIYRSKSNLSTIPPNNVGY